MRIYLGCFATGSESLSTIIAADGFFLFVFLLADTNLSDSSSLEVSESNGTGAILPDAAFLFLVVDIVRTGADKTRFNFNSTGETLPTHSPQRLVLARMNENKTCGEAEMSNFEFDNGPMAPYRKRMRSGMSHAVPYRRAQSKRSMNKAPKPALNFFTRLFVTFFL